MLCIFSIINFITFSKFLYNNIIKEITKGKRKLTFYQQEGMLGSGEWILEN